MEASRATSSQQDQTLVQIAPSAEQLFKPSRFNAFTLESEKGILLLYNSMTGHRCGIPTDSADLAKAYLSQPVIRGPLDTLGQYMRDKGYIVPNDLPEDALWDMKYGHEQYRTDKLELILLASEDCNFRCIYCSQQFKRGSMLPSVRKGVKELVLSRIKKLRIMNISWFGGEPMLGYDAIEELAPFFQESCREHEVAFSSNITTNGYLLTPERSVKMVGWGITDYQITVDGAAAEHDSHRPLKEGGATFATIFNNIVAMKEIKDDFRVQMRVNFDNTNYPHLEKLFELYASRVAGDSRFVMTFYPVGKWGGPNDENLDVCGAKKQAEVATSLREQAARHGLKSDKASRYLEPEGNVCYAARPYNYIVGSDGKLMKCTVVLDTLPDNIVGNLREDGTPVLNHQLLTKWIQPYYKHDAMCSRCFFVPVCQGNSCPLPRITDNQRPCPPPKLEIHHTLRMLWAEDSTMARRRQLSVAVPSSGAAPE